MSPGVRARAATASRPPLEPPLRFAPDDEWLEADGLGGFASGTVGGVRTRRYHAVLLASLAPPVRRVALVNGLEAWVETAALTRPISSHRYAPGVTHPDGATRLSAFEPEPWPRWKWRLEDGTEIEQELLVPRGLPAALIAWRRTAGRGPARLRVRPLLSGRDFHSLHRENPGFGFGGEASDGRVRWDAYPGMPNVVARHDGRYAPCPEWFRNFLYEEERRRGLDGLEDLGSPGEFTFDLAAGEGVLLLCAGAEAEAAAAAGGDAAVAARRLRAVERMRRGRFPSRLHRAADAYVVRRGAGATIVAGYPWFSDWGRDTFIAMRGVCLGRREDARRILTAWAGLVSEGMLPNRFADEGPPEFNSVDASLWFVVAAREWLEAAPARGGRAGAAARSAVLGAVDAIVTGYAAGTRFGIRMDADGLLSAGVPGTPGTQLTWMDARVSDRAITPRIGKPVEVQALWLHALDFAAGRDARWREPLARGRASFEARFWNEAAGALFDVVDVDHRPGTADPTFRPNQILAVGGLPLTLLDGTRARRVVDAVESRLWTPTGLRSLAPGEAEYRPRYEGGPAERDAAYHQGTVWPWLTGPFVEAWVRVRGGTSEARAEARARFVAPLLAHLDHAGLGHVSEIADAEPPHAPRGCPFQAWSLGELLRLEGALPGERASALDSPPA